MSDDDPEFVPIEELEDEDVEEPIEPEEEPADVIFDGKRGYVVKEEADRISQQGFYGTRLDDGRLELEPVELLHLIERKRIRKRLLVLYYLMMKIFGCDIWYFATSEVGDMRSVRDSVVGLDLGYMQEGKNLEMRAQIN